MDGPTDPAPSTRTNFLWWCAGVIPETLKVYPSERAKYEGIGGAVLTTGLLAFLSGFYAVYTTIGTGISGAIAAVGFGLLWGLAIFNLDRYIVASLRKPSDPGAGWRQRLAASWGPALPRIGLAILIAITLSKPLELRLFSNAIAGQAAITHDRAVTERRATLTEGTRLSTLNEEWSRVQAQVADAEGRARLLEDEFRKEADGTGGSQRYGYSEVARLKEAAALQARQNAEQVRASLEPRRSQLQMEIDGVTADIDSQVETFRAGLADDFLTRMAALSELTANSSAIWWISAFVTFLIVGIEITPVVVKLLSPIGPYDIKLDAMNRVEAHEARLNAETAVQIATHHYMHTEAAEKLADDQFLEIRKDLVQEELHRRSAEWKEAKAAGSGDTMEKLVRDVRSQVFTLRSP